MNDEQERGEELKKRFEVQKKVDTEWKRKVELEKRKLAAPAGGTAAAGGKVPPTAASPGAAPFPEKSPAPAAAPPRRGMDMGFVSLVQQLSDQAALFLGLVPGYPERHCDQALAAIEMLKTLEGKTKGNLSDEESKALTGVLYELQMRYVQTCGGGAA